MKKLFAFLFVVFISVGATQAVDFFPAANVGYVKMAMITRGCFLDNNAPSGQGVNMEYLLKTVDICNGNLTFYGASAQATKQWANTQAVNWSAENLVALRPYSQDGLIVHLDAINNTGSGHDASATVWKDISGHGYDFILYNSPKINANDIAFDGSNQYARSTNQLSLSALSAVTIEVSFRFLSANETNQNFDQASMLFELSSNWNTNVGAFGVSINSDGHKTDPNICHTVHNISGAAAGANNYTILLGDMTYHKMTNTFSTTPNSTGRLLYHDGELVSPSGLYQRGTAVYGPLRNDYLFLATRAGTASFANIAIQSLRVYNRQLSAREVCNNAWIDYARFGGTQPHCQ